ncbi:MAG: 16S rRNA (guanine(527)-N(7))-methyltransferase RsmG [Candidatus Kapabacteria bacterium]|nr:16S rRNA (guanine(527)-N(7))-methyltransferase RsmG [Candidatus Kapabacteria bacterium]MCS7169942.1 16S rRNA (guanine(527)-N(7))-methyltransferase RsmG [Candidatus Kapabacteria bacterium]MDW7996379.1 16S rRNA (guanine(527)-N(7))-methyltransferase RsmG [Bacteroidota bacterium]MDW8225992.1 16S rRNA (guanine(527)-N(7))-methyltransferase RsmG [Bacteroidota bacterium]
MDLIQFWTVCAANGIVLEQEQLAAFDRYARELRYWNERVNLVSRADIEYLYERHFLHSLAPLKYLSIHPRANCIDIGTGAGLPGIPLAIARPDLHMLLIEAVAKKARLVALFASHTGLPNLQVKRARVEELHEAPSYCTAFDFAFARAVASLPTLLSWAQPLLKPTGQLIAYKGGDLSRELHAAQSRFPQARFTVQDIRFHGAPWFEENQKRLVFCRLAPAENS